MERSRLRQLTTGHAFAELGGGCLGCASSLHTHSPSPGHAKENIMKIKPPPACTGSPPPNVLAAIERRLGPIEYRSTQSLTAYAGNPRKHPEKQIVKLMSAINHFGFAV